MYKYLIIFIIAVFFTAICISKCGEDETYDYDTDSTEEFVHQSHVQKAEEDSDEPDIIKEKEISLTDSSLSGVEIPKLQRTSKEQIINRIGYTISYNVETKNPNWVAWCLTKEHTTGPVPRYKGYIDDYDIAGYTPKEEDWIGMPQYLSHGHMCPAGDNKWDEKAMEQTFLLSNMCPQNDRLNSGSWNKLEMKCRDWANRFGSIYIVCGPVFNYESIETMGSAKIWIPYAFYKVILCLEGNAKAIGFIYTNDDSSHNMQKSVRSVDEIEEITGIDFFHSLEDSLEDSIESRAEWYKWQ